MDADNVTFDAQYYQLGSLDPSIKKLEQAIYVHGYRGASRRKRNGIVPIRPSDSKLLKDYRKYLSAVDIDVPQKVTPIKIVAHVTNGDRLIGFLADGKVHILGLSNYN